MTKSLRYNAPSFVPQSDTAALAESPNMAQPAFLQEPRTDNSISSSIYDGSVFTPRYEHENYIGAMSTSDVVSPQSDVLMEVQVQYPNFSHETMQMQQFFQPQAVMVVQGQNQFTWPTPTMECQDWYQGPSVQSGFQPQALDMTNIMTDDPWAESQDSRPNETDDFPEIFVDFAVTGDNVSVKIRVEDSVLECATPPTCKSGLSAGAKEFVPRTPHVEISTPRSLNGAAPAFVSRVLPNMIPDQEVVYPNVYEPVFFPSYMPEFEEVLPYDVSQWTNYSVPQKTERYIPPNKYHFKTFTDIPHAASLKKCYLIDMLLAMRSFFAKPTDSIIEVFLSNPALKGSQKVSAYVEENILIRLAIANGEYPDRFPIKESGFQLTPLILPKKRKKSKKKSTHKTAEAPKPSKKAFQLEKTSELSIKPNIQEQNRVVLRRALVDKKSFIKKFKCILNKITPENMEVMTTEVRCLGDEWTEEILKIAVSLIHANVIRNAAFAPVYSEFSMRISNLFPEVAQFKTCILVNIKDTLNLRGDPEHEPKDSIFLSKRLKKVNISNLLGELFLKNLMEIEEIFKVSRALINAFSDQIPGYQELCLECLVVLVKICGSKLQVEDQETLDDMMAQLTAMSHDENIPKRIRFLLDDVVELRNNEWVSCRSKKEIQPQRIEVIRAEFMATQTSELQGRHLHSPKSKRNGKTSPKTKKSCISRRLAAKSKKLHSKERAKKSKPRNLFSGGVIKSKMNYRMAARTAAEKRQTAVKERMLERVEIVVKSMDSSEMKKFAVNNPDWRTFLLQRLLRKWRLRPHRKSVRMIINALQVEAITTSELHEAFRKCGITEKEFKEDSTAVKSPISPSSARQDGKPKPFAATIPLVDNEEK